MIIPCIFVTDRVTLYFQVLTFNCFIMMTNYKSWLFAALFVFFGAFSSQAQMYDWFIYLDLQHVESDYVPAEESDYYRHFLTLDNVEPNYMRSPLNLDFLAEGNNTFILCRYPVKQSGEAVMTPVANVTFTAEGDVVNYEITYMNQEPLPGYNLELVTQGTLPVEDGDVNLENLVMVDQLKVLVRDEYEEVVDNSKIYPWMQCGYVMFLDNGDFDVHTNNVEVPQAPRAPLYTLGNYSWFDLKADEDVPTLQAGMKNAYFECFNLKYFDPEVTGYMVLRGDNTYPTDTISYVTRIENSQTFMEESHALPEYFGEENQWTINRNDTSLMVLGTYGDYMTYVPVTRTDGSARVKQDGENTYGGYVMKTGVAGLDGSVSGIVLDQSSETPMMFKDENGVDCVVFKPIFDLLITMPDYSTYEYWPSWVTIWVKSDNLRDYYIDDDGNPVNIPYEEDEEEEEYQNNGYMCLGGQDIVYGHWDEELDEYVYDFTGQLIIGDDEDEWCGFAATCATAREGVTFIVRFYYESMDMMPSKDTPIPSYCIVEKQVKWIPIPNYTGVKEMGSGIEVGKTYYNVQGIASNKPYDGFNIVVTHYSDGSTKTTKEIK